MSCRRRSAASLAAGLEIDAERAREHLDVTSLGLVYSQSVLLALVASGMSRDDAYRVVQEAAATAAKEHRAFREVLEADLETSLDAATLDRAFDLDRLLAHRGRFLDAIEGLG